MECLEDAPLEETFPVFPVEAVVAGVPRAHNAHSRKRWQDVVKSVTRGSWTRASPSQTFVTILYFSEGPMQGDVDNIVKPILDAMNKGPYEDDSQVKRVIVEKFEPGDDVAFERTTPHLIQALSLQPPVVYIRVDDRESVEEIWS